jgi:hypothetical protein
MRLGLGGCCGYAIGRHAPHDRVKEFAVNVTDFVATEELLFDLIAYPPRITLRLSAGCQASQRLSQKGRCDQPSYRRVREPTVLRVRQVTPCCSRDTPRSVAGPLGTVSGPVQRRVIERTHAWLDNFRRLRIRFERRADIHEAFVKLGCCLIVNSAFAHAKHPTTEEGI